MKVGIIAGAHGNADATREGLELLSDCQSIVHLGDAIGLGPDPKETAEMLLDANVICLKGVYEEKLEKDEEGEHISWLRQEVGALAHDLSGFPYARKDIIKGTLFLSWPRDWRGFLPPPASPSTNALARVFKKEKGKPIFFGRERKGVDIARREGKLLCPGALGLSEVSLVNALVLHLAGEEMIVEERSVFYDPRGVLQRLRKKAVPGYGEPRDHQ